MGPLSQRADIYRLQADLSVTGRKTERIWRKDIACHLEPISSQSSAVPFALESTHVILLPIWLWGVRLEDEFRISGHINLDGDRLPDRYICTGVRKYPTFGDRHTEVYVKMRR